MDNIFEKIGIYDFGGTLMPGFIGIIIYNLQNGSIFKLDSEQSFLYSLVVYIVLSYILGTILHEAGNFIQNYIVYRNGKEPCDVYLLDDCKILNDVEKEIYKKLYLKWSKKNNIKQDLTKNSCRLFFNYCDYYIENKSKCAKAKKMQALYGMARSLFVLFLVISLINLFRTNYINFFIDLFLTIIFYNRMKRFNIIRLKVVMRTYYLVTKNSGAH